MNQQLALLHQRMTWMHFIGGYYSNTDKFVAEALKTGISRRASALSVKNMNFGDRIILLRYGRNDSTHAFAEAEVTGISLDHEIAQKVGLELKATGKATWHEPSGGAITIIRECGSYNVSGTWTVDAPLPEIIDMAIRASGDTPLFFMVNARITEVYDNPVYIQPAPKFTRGFVKCPDDSEYFITEPHVYEPTIFAITNYAKA